MARVFTSREEDPHRMRVLAVDSRNRLNTGGAAGAALVKAAVADSHVDGVALEAGLYQFVMPQCLYNITATRGNNTISITDAGSDSDTWTVPDGNYTLAQLLAYITAAVAAGPLTTLKTITFTAADYTGRYTIAGFTTGDIATNILLADTLLARQLGFVTAQTAAASTFAATGLPDIAWPKRLLLCVEEAGHHPLRSTHDGKSYRALDVIQVLENFGELIDRRFEAPLWVELGDRDHGLPLSSLSFSLRDEDGNLAELNGGEWLAHVVVRMAH